MAPKPTVKKKPLSSVTKSNTKKRAMLKALEKSLGVVTAAANQVGIDRVTHYRWMESDPSYKTAVESIADIALDFAESELYRQIKDGEVTSTIFYLKTKGKRRGYIEKTEVEANVNGNISMLTMPEFMRPKEGKDK